MKLPPLALFRRLAVHFVLLTACNTFAAPPTVQPLLPGKWPAWPRGEARGVKVVGNYAYVVLSGGNLAVFDVSNPANCLRVGGYDIGGIANDVTVSGNYAYVANETAGMQVMDVSNPSNCVRVGGYDTSGAAFDVAVSGN